MLVARTLISLRTLERRSSIHRQHSHFMQGVSLNKPLKSSVDRVAEQAAGIFTRNRRASDLQGPSTRMLNEDDEEIGNATLDIALGSGEEYSTCVAFILLGKHSSAYPFLRQGTESKRLTQAWSRRRKETFYPKEEIGYLRNPLTTDLGVGK
jgi:hypothetical protein